jgi:hypothetical protein
VIVGAIAPVGVAGAENDSDSADVPFELVALLLNL